MRQIPMLFSPAMIEALLAGRKTETRRTKFAIKGYPNFLQFGRSDTRGYDWTFRRKDHVWEDFRHDELMKRMQTQVGDLIWVKENYRIGAWRTEQWARGNGECDADVAVDYMADNHARKEWLNSGDPEVMMRLVEQSRAEAKADGRFKQGAEFEYRWSPGESPCRIRPSIHMPKAFSRLTLRVTGFNIERLHDIDEARAIAEGIIPYDGIDPSCQGFINYRNNSADGHWLSAINSYRTLWNSINGPNAWDANPWVSVTKFEVLRQNVEDVAR